METGLAGGQPNWDWVEARRRCLALAMGLLRRRRDDAEDAVQEAMVRGFKHWRSCKDQSNPTSWLMAITRRECMRSYSRKGGEVMLLEECEGHLSSADPCDVAASRTDLHAALTTLRAEEERLFMLRYVRHLTQAEVAEFCGVPEGTVKTRLHRVRAKIRSKMEVI